MKLFVLLIFIPFSFCLPCLAQDNDSMQAYKLVPGEFVRTSQGHVDDEGHVTEYVRDSFDRSSFSITDPALRHCLVTAKLIEYKNGKKIRETYELIRQKGYDGTKAGSYDSGYVFSLTRKPLFDNKFTWGFQTASATNYDLAEMEHPELYRICALNYDRIPVGKPFVFLAISTWDSADNFPGITWEARQLDKPYDWNRLFHLTHTFLIELTIEKADASQEAAAVRQQNPDWNYIDTSGILSRDSITKDGYTLLFINKDTALNDTVKHQLIQTFFTVYPKEAKEYNQNTAKTVTFIMDPDYKGVAATGGALVRFNPEWFHKHPKDIDVVTHEVMHVVQSYHGDNTPGWLTEGIADYVRAKYGVDNAGAGWKLPDYSPKQNYTDAYRVTARFLIWTEKKYDKKLVQKMDAALRDDTYQPGLWKTLTGKTVDELWKEYGKKPAI